METTNIIRIPNPSPELVAFLKAAQERKRERMDDLIKRLMNGDPSIKII